MKLYNYLFYKSYILGVKSRNFDVFPVVGGVIFMFPTVLMNVFAVVLLLEAWGILAPLGKEGSFVLTFAVMFLLIFYYQYKGRYKRVVQEYEEKKEKIYIHPIIACLTSYLISFALGTLASLYLTKDWIFE